MAKLRGKVLAKYEASRNLGAELLAAAQEIKSGRAAREHRIKVPDILETRMRSGLSQQKFAEHPRGLASHTRRMGTGAPQADRCRALSSDNRSQAAGRIA